MSATAKIQHKGQVTIPTRVRRQARLSKGDVVEFSYQRGKIVITPKMVIDRFQFRTADDEYTPAQRRIIDARLAEALTDVKASRVSKAYSDHGAFLADLHKAANKIGRRKAKRSLR